jgi:FAD:protein FMN transferase
VDTVALSLHAMATRFELVLHGEDAVRLRAAGEQALQEIERLERQLSFYRPDSEITWINARAGDGPVKVEPRLFRLLAQCARLSVLTDGAFDVTVGPLVRAWGFAGGSGAIPGAQALAEAREVVGIRNVQLDEDDYSIRFLRPGVEIDLGGYGKGYAIERAVELLRECGITSALLHGGTSSVYAIGAPPGGAAWKIALSAPFLEGEVVALENGGLSVSAVHGKSFDVEGETFGHVLDPRTGESVRGALAAAVVGPSPAECEALSTALLVLGKPWLPTLRAGFPGYTGTVVSGQ